MLDRRDVLKLAALALAARPMAALAAGAADPGEALLNRLTFGATDADRDALRALGPRGWLDDQLSRPARDAGLDARLAGLRLRIAYDAGDDGEGGAWPATEEMRPLSALGADPATLLPLLDYDRPMDYAERMRPADEVIAAALTRAVHAPAQLREVMTQLWHDHFNVHSMKSESTSIAFPAYDATLRDYALGRFRDLLGAVTASPAMLVYLNNDESRAAPANENLARELLELHTLGADAYLSDLHSRWAEVPKGADGLALGYIDEDVYEVARALTGWSVGDGRWVAEGQETPRTGRFAYVEAWHDPYQKRVLGREFAPNRAPLADGEEVLDILAVHPATARHVCRKIARRLLADDPDEALVARLAAVFARESEAPDQIARVVRALVDDPAFAAPPTKLRRPFEVLAALYRATGAEAASPENAYHWHLARAGWEQHTYPAPNGHADRSEAWSGGSTMLRLIDLALYAHDDWFGGTTTRLSAAVPAGVRRLGDLAAFWAARLQGPGAETMADVWRHVGADPGDALPDDEGSRHDLSVVAVTMAAISPRFLLR